MTSEREMEYQRLPSGRHGLPREAVERSQRERIIRAMLACVAEKGYPATTVADVIAAAGVSRTTFYEFWSDKEDCFVGAYDALLAVLMSRVDAAYSDQGGPWAQRASAGLEAFLHWLSAYPELARVAIVEAPAAGSRAVDRYRAAAGRFIPFFEEGRAQAPHADELPDGLEVVVVGGIAEIVFEEVAAGRAAQLPQLLPEFLYTALSPFLGHEQAVEEMERAAARVAG